MIVTATRGHNHDRRAVRNGEVSITVRGSPTCGPSSSAPAPASRKDTNPFATTDLEQATMDRIHRLQSEIGGIRKIYLPVGPAWIGHPSTGPPPIVRSGYPRDR